MVRVLFVCTGNICRSPMAEGLLRKLLHEQERPGEFIVESAGTLPMNGAPASSNSVDVCLEQGIDIHDHVSREITKEMIDDADLVLTMEEDHRQHVLALCPDAGEKSFVITRYAGLPDAMGGVADPLGLAKDEYEATFHEIEASIKAALPKILALSEEGSEPTRKRAD